jgi:hypothetical protein
MRILSKTLFAIGILLAIALSFVPFGGGHRILGLTPITFGIIVAGFIVGIMNIKGTKTNNFLITTIMLIVTGNAGLFVVQENSTLTFIMLNILAFIGPAAVMVSLKAVYDMAK